MEIDKTNIILNPDGSIYHLGLFPNEINDIILTVGAPDRVKFLNFYSHENKYEKSLIIELKKHLNIDDNIINPYAFDCDISLFNKFSKTFINSGITLTNPGFYGPQSRSVRIPLKFEKLNDKLNSFNYSGKKITNLDMETSGIYGLCKLLDHKSLSVASICT